MKRTRGRCGTCCHTGRPVLSLFCWWWELPGAVTSVCSCQEYSFVSIAGLRGSQELQLSSRSLSGLMAQPACVIVSVTLCRARSTCSLGAGNEDVPNIMSDKYFWGGSLDWLQIQPSPLLAYCRGFWVSLEEFRESILQAIPRKYRVALPFLPQRK